jgi:hypothetical protein
MQVKLLGLLASPKKIPGHVLCVELNKFAVELGTNINTGQSNTLNQARLGIEYKTCFPFR